MGGIISLSSKKVELKYICATDDTVRFISYHNFCSLGHFPRFPENEELVIHLSVDDISNAFIVFVSRCWIPGDGEENRSQTDRKHRDQYQLCVNGVKELHHRYATNVTNCFIWLDFCCLNQEYFPASELVNLEKIMSYCDVLLTPIIDEDFKAIPLRTQILKYYKAHYFCDSKYGYLNSSWNRLELLCNSCTKISLFTQNKLRHFHGELKYIIEQRKRPHFLMTTKDSKHHMPPLLLPYISTDILLSELSPLKGHHINGLDDRKVQHLIEQFVSNVKENSNATEEKELNNSKVLIDTEASDSTNAFYHAPHCNYKSYIGHKNASNQRHGEGKTVYHNGDVFGGLYVDGIRQGHGVFMYSNGARYTGEWLDGMMHGFGELVRENKNR